MFIFMLLAVRMHICTNSWVSRRFRLGVITYHLLICTFLNIEQVRNSLVQSARASHTNIFWLPNNIFSGGNTRAGISTKAESSSMFQDLRVSTLCLHDFKRLLNMRRRSMRRSGFSLVCSLMALNVLRIIKTVI